MFINKISRVIFLLFMLFLSNSFSNNTYNSEVWAALRFVYQNTPPPGSWFWDQCEITSEIPNQAGNIYAQDDYKLITNITVNSILPKSTTGYTLSNFTGTLPAGLNLNNTTGEISGIPTNLDVVGQLYSVTADATPTNGTP